MRYYWKNLSKLMYKNARPLLVSVLLIGFFIFSSWLSKRYASELSALVLDGYFDEAAYLLLAAFASLLAGFSSTPLIPLALAIWGLVPTVLLTATGWTLGSLAAFLLSRRFGVKLACRMVNICDLEDYQKRIKTNGLFGKLLLARIFLPIDILSYAIGLFTKMSWISFSLATFLGSALFTLVVIYASALPVITQVILGLGAILVFFLWARKIINDMLLK